jgi:anti-sigma28 factor (negative regulator of flagellin synthesis)
MSDLSPIVPGGPGTIGPIHRIGPMPASAEGPIERGIGGVHRGDDSVELSERARLLDQLRQMPAVRLERVEAVRHAIAAGDYETPDKLDRAVDAMLEDFEQFPE